MAELGDTYRARYDAYASKLRELVSNEAAAFELAILETYAADTEDAVFIHDCVSVIFGFAGKPVRRRGKNSIRKGDLWQEINLPFNNSFWVSICNHTFALKITSKNSQILPINQESLRDFDRRCAWNARLSITYIGMFVEL